MKKNLKRLTAMLLLVVLCLNLTVCASASGDAASTETTADTEASAAEAETTGLDNYTLEKMVIFSRHNMRAPTKSAGSVLTQVTPYEWTDYTAPNGETTLLGGTQETAMGQYFRKYLTDKGLMEENWVPDEDEVRFYANSYQRTISTANYFATGMLPVANVDVEYHNDIGTMDPVFKPCLNMISDAWLAQVQEEMDALADGTGMQGYMAQYADDIALLEDVIDFADSPYAAENNVTAFPMEESTVTYELGEEPKAAGGLKLANSAADALVMQYYADPDLVDAAFGQDLTWEQWQSFGRVQSMYSDILFGLPSVATNVANPLLQELKGELTDDDRVFSFLCGHDSNVLPLMVTLGVEDYTIEDNISDSTPIGCKLVWEKYLGQDGTEYCRFCLVYQDSESLRNNELVTLQDPPCWVELSLSGLEKNEDGLYLWDDVIARFDEAIDAYADLPVDEAAAA